MENIKSLKRIDEIDIGKGLLIICVVIGHAQISTDLKNLIYWFHMPLFFFISGFLISNSKIGDVAAFKYILKKVLKLLVPYLSFMLLIAGMSLFLRAGETNLLSQEFLARAILGGKFLVNQFGVFWFITCLAGTTLLYALLEKFVVNKNLKICLVIILFLLGHLESYFIQNGAKIFIPYNIDTAFVTLTYFFIGSKFKSFLTTSTPKSFKILSSGLICLSALALLIFSDYITNQSLDLKYQIYQHPILTLLLPFFFGLLLMGCSYLINKFKISILITEFGRHSLTIMYLHLFLKILLENYNLYHNATFIILGLFVPLLISLLLQKNEYTRFLFLGDSKYLEDIFPEYIFKKIYPKYPLESELVIGENNSKRR